MLNKFFWATITILAIGVAGYSLANVLVPGVRGEFVVAMFHDDPITAPAHLAGGAIALLLGSITLDSDLPS